MMQSFAELISPTGCFSTRSGRAYIQQSAQSYIRSEARRYEVDRRSVVHAIITSSRVDSTLRAKVECFLFRALTIEQWRRVHLVGIDCVVKDYIKAIKAAATRELISQRVALAYELETAM